MNLPEAPVLLTGTVLSVAETKDFETKAPNGANVIVMNGEGATQVKLDLNQLRLLAPIAGDSIAWHVRFRLWSMDGGRFGLSCSFIVAADLGSLDAIHQIVAAVKEPAGK